MFAAVLAISVVGVRAHLADAQSNSAPASTSSDHDLIAEYRHVEVASVSDALEQITGKKMYMSHRMQPIFTSKFAGYARTVQLKKDEGNKDPEALSGMLQAIDEGSTDAVYVMVVEDGEDIAGMGGLMGTAMAARGYCRSGDRRRGTRCGLFTEDRIPGFCHGDRSLHFRPSLSLRRSTNAAGLQWSAGESRRHRGGR